MLPQRTDPQPHEIGADDQLPVVGMGDRQVAADRGQRRQHRIDRQCVHRHQAGAEQHEFAEMDILFPGRRNSRDDVMGHEAPMGVIPRGCHPQDAPDGTLASLGRVHRIIAWQISR